MALQPKASIRADEEAWELVKDSSDPEDLQFFLESFPDSGLSKVAKLKLRMMRKKEKQIEEEPKTEEIKPKKKRNKNFTALLFYVIFFLKCSIIIDI